MALEPFASEEVTVDATAGGVALTAATYTPVGASRAEKAVITFETANFRYWVDGTAPTSSSGHFVNVAVQSIPIVLRSFEEIAAFRAIRTTGVSGLLKVSYYR